VTGIAAIWSREERPPASWAERVESLLGALAHRGGAPGAWASSRGALGLRARCTLPEDAGATQPMVDGDLALVADVRLDNRDELHLELGVPSDACDAAIVLAAYRRWGPGCAARLAGDFAFAVIDGEQQLLFCARDPFGGRPLYYHEADAIFFCASEPGALIIQPDIPRRAHLDQIALYLDGAYNESDATLFDGIRTLPGGHALTADRAGVRLRRYWSPDPWRRVEADEQAATELVREGVCAAVKRRLRSSSRVAVYLSGGLDSAVVAGEAERLRRAGWGPREKPILVHASFPGNPEDETTYSDAVAVMWDLPTINARVLDDTRRFRPSVEGPLDIPYDPRVGMWNQMLETSVACGASVGLTGDGVDECLRGTGFEWTDALRAARLGRIARESGLARRPWSVERWRSAVMRTMRPLIHPLERGLTNLQPHPLLTPAYATRVREHERQRRKRLAERRYPSLVARELCRSFEEGNHNLTVGVNERVAARQGIELRNGLFDKDLVELLLALPHEERHVVGLDKPKPVLRRAAEGVVPSAVLRRSRSGSYGRFLDRVLFREHHDAIRHIFAHSRLADAGMVRRDIAAQLADGSTEAPRKTGRSWWLLQVTGLVAMEMLLRQL
jgi:asparagine synthase (glutamine-hydrolysing)